MVQLLNSIYLGAAKPEDYGKAAGVVELLPFDYYLGAAVPGGSTPRIIDIILSGVSPLTLLNAHSLNYLKAFGGTELEPETYLDTVTLSGGCEQRNLPSGYTQLEYLEGNGDQYIDTGVTLTQDDSLECIFAVTEDRNTARFIFGRRSSDANINNIAVNVANAGDSVYADMCNGDYSTYRATPTTISLNTKYRAVINKNVRGIYNYATGATVTENTTLCTDTITTGNCLVFASAVSDVPTVINKFVGRIYSAKCTGKFNLIPAKRNSDNVLGMYDTVTNTFFTNAGEGTFTAGADVVPSPNTPIDIVCNNGVLKVKDSELPLGYKRILGLTMNNDCYYKIDDFYLTGADTIKFAYSFTGTACNVLGSYTASSAQDNLSLYIGTSSSAKYLRYNGGTYSSYTVADTRYDVKITPTGSIGMETEATWTQKSFTCPVEFLIGTTGESTTSSKLIGDLYENIEVVGRLKLIPCERLSDNEIVYYDTYTGTVYEPIGTTPISLGYDYSHMVVYIDGTQETVTDSLGNTANAERLLAINTYKDTQEVLSGTVTRNVGIKVFDGSENWFKISNQSAYFIPILDMLFCNPVQAGLSNQFIGSSAATADMPDNSIKLTYVTSPNSGAILFKHNDTTTLEAWAQFVTNKYNSGNPIFAIYPLATATTSTVTGQFLSKSPVTQTAGSISNLPIAITESQKTVPTPTHPLDINCNNGVVKVNSQGQIYTDGTTETVEITGQNLLDLANCVDGYYYSPTGEYGPATSARLSNFIPVKAGVTYTVFAYGLAGSANVRVNLLDTQKNWLSQDLMATTLGEYIAISVTPTQDGYLAFSANYITNSRIDWSLSQVVRGAYTVATMPAYTPYFNGGTATAEMLLKVGNYKDVQSILDGAVTRNIGIKVFDGTEDWHRGTNTIYVDGLFNDTIGYSSNNPAIICSHFRGLPPSTSISNMPDLSAKLGGAQYPRRLYFAYDAMTTAAQFKQFLAQQYAAGTPVIVVYPLATPTTESVTGQTVTVQEGTNIVEITQASMSGLTMEVSYKAYVTVTIQEIEAVNSDSNVTVTIS